jgi:hypothetical protein
MNIRGVREMVTKETYEDDGFFSVFRLRLLQKYF